MCNQPVQFYQIFIDTFCVRRHAHPDLVGGDGISSAIPLGYVLDYRTGQFQGLDLLPGVPGLAENLVGLRSQQGGWPAYPHGGL